MLFEMFPGSLQISGIAARQVSTVCACFHSLLGDLVGRPKVGQRSWSDLNDLASLVEAGRVAMQASMPQLLELVEA